MIEVLRFVPIIFWFNFKSLGNKYGASVSINILSVGMYFNKLLTSLPLLGSQIHPVIPI